LAREGATSDPAEMAKVTRTSYVIHVCMLEHRRWSGNCFCARPGSTAVRLLGLGQLDALADA